MKFVYRTERLELRILEPDSAQLVLDFQLANAELFQKFEPLHSEGFFTLKHQRSILSAEYNAALHMELIRFWMFLREDPDTIIGTVSFRSFIRGSEQSCRIGYKMDERYWHHGYMTEAVEKTSDIIFDELDIHRIIASILPENEPSLNLVRRLGFTFEGIDHQALLVNGSWKDHERWALINPIDQFLS